jgi:hypothetical protein
VKFAVGVLYSSVGRMVLACEADMKFDFEQSLSHEGNLITTRDLPDKLIVRKKKTEFSPCVYESKMSYPLQII